MRGIKFFLLFGMALLLISCGEQISSVERVLAEQADANSNEVLVIAHRGDWRGAPENSLQGFENCISYGVDMVELDVRQTKDGELIIMHDVTVDRTTNGKGQVSDLTLDELRELRLRNGLGRVTTLKIPTFEEVLLLCKDRVVIHLDKGYDLFREVYALTEKTGTTHQVMFKTSHHPDKVRRDYGDIITKVPYVPVVTFGGEGVAKVIDGHIELGAVAIEFVFSKVTSEVLEQMERVRAAGVKVCVGSMWPSADGGYDDDRAVEEGADKIWGWIVRNGGSQIMSDRPFELMDYLRQSGRHR